MMGRASDFVFYFMWCLGLAVEIWSFLREDIWGKGDGGIFLAFDVSSSVLRYLRSVNDFIGLVLILRTSGTRRSKADLGGKGEEGEGVKLVSTPFLPLYSIQLWDEEQRMLPCSVPAITHFKIPRIR